MVKNDSSFFIHKLIRYKEKSFHLFLILISISIIIIALSIYFSFVFMKHNSTLDHIRKNVSLQKNTTSGLSSIDINDVSKEHINYVKKIYSLSLSKRDIYLCNKLSSKYHEGCIANYFTNLALLKKNPEVCMELMNYIKKTSYALSCVLLYSLENKENRCNILGKYHLINERNICNLLYNETYNNNNINNTLNNSGR